MSTEDPAERESSRAQSGRGKAARGAGGWTWKVEESRRGDDPGLLYEPGNWGDVLKGTWAIHVARALRAAAAATRSGGGRDGLHCVDPWAGAASYPLVGAAAERIEWLGGGEYASSQRDWIARGRLASTARLVMEAGSGDGARGLLEVFDSDPERLASWKEVDGVRRLDVESGEDALGPTDADLVLVDPYDLFDRWPEILPGVLEAARGSWVLLYLYNKAPRGGGHARGYRDLRRRLEAGAPGPALVGRIPSDLVLPRAFHEVVLLGPREPDAGHERALVRATKSLACRMSTSGAFERLG